MTSAPRFLSARQLAPLLALAVIAAADCRRRLPKAPSAQASPPATETQQDAYRQPDRLIAALSLLPGQRVAEIGAGGGYLTMRLARAVGPTGHVVATDIDAGALAALRRRARAAGPNQIAQIETRLVQPQSPGLEAGAYDLVLLAQVDHLFPDRATYLRALLPALRPGGRIAVSNTERHHAALLGALRLVPVTARELPIGLPGQFLILMSP